MAAACTVWTYSSGLTYTRTVSYIAEKQMEEFRRKKEKNTGLPKVNDWYGKIA